MKILVAMISMAFQFVWLNVKRIGIAEIDDYFTIFSNLYEMLLSNSEQLRHSQIDIANAIRGDKSKILLPK